AQEYLRAQNISGWLLYDYRDMNPIFWDTLGPIGHVTRPCWLWIAAEAPPRLLVSYVDQGRFTDLGIETTLFVSRKDMTAKLGDMLAGADRIAMEYSPQGALPRVSRIDAGTLELVRSFGVDVVSSADLLQHATQRWNGEQLDSHLAAARALGDIVLQAFRRIGDKIDESPTEFDIAEFIRQRFLEEGMIVTDGPVVAANAHAADPHFEPTEENTSVIQRGDWILIDLWTRQPHEDAMFADITWTAYVGDNPTPRHRQVFDTVIGGRDAAVDVLERAHREGRTLEGWELDAAAREYITQAGFGDYFNHRLGHSLGREVHSNAVNLDGWETHDTRKLIPGVAVTVEPGIYLPGEFGVRSEIDLFVGDSGPRVTTQMQRDVVLIDA
ncbi:MAG: M24 family metallopeptidase, partial [Chloroflexi bacterium]|nr:M24 family metallopeptidase [Chloroflexota bacterium]